MYLYMICTWTVRRRTAATQTQPELLRKCSHTQYCYPVLSWDSSKLKQIWSGAGAIVLWESGLLQPGTVRVVKPLAYKETVGSLYFEAFGTHLEKSMVMEPTLRKEVRPAESPYNSRLTWLWVIIKWGVSFVSPGCLLDPFIAVL